MDALTAPKAKIISQMTRTELLNLPDRPWDQVKTYNSLLVIPTRRKHESGFRIMAVIGVDEGGVPVEIACQCADYLAWYADQQHPLIAPLRTDCIMKNGALHFWGGGGFTVGASLSSLDIHVLPRK